MVTDSNMKMWVRRSDLCVGTCSTMISELRGMSEDAVGIKSTFWISQVRQEKDAKGSCVYYGKSETFGLEPSIFVRGDLGLESPEVNLTMLY
ncbi:unnamed protein product [Toxocara canis]|uniref:TAXi_C domain-containing protein n=1 Tax=Toxocara canis TaxID=6265 RepID=A0A183U0F0_TOXCA|nr:unnamed protein product [Toxocara canis]